MNQPTMDQKKQLRQNLQSLSLSQTSRETAQGNIVLKINQIIKSYQPSSILSYFGFKDEPQIEVFDAGGACCYYPRIKDYQKKSMDFFKWSPGDASKLNNYGIKEPVCNVPMEIDAFSTLILLPGLLFDFQGNRLGHGGGFYDRFLEAYDFKLKIGVCFEERIRPELPVGINDIGVDVVVTQKRIVYV